MVSARWRACGHSIFNCSPQQVDPDGLWVAEADGEMLGFAFSWVCGDLWFLAELFVSPGQQGRGIGNELLMRTFEHARKAGVRNKALDHLHVQYRVARSIHPTRTVSSAARSIS